MPDQLLATIESQLDSLLSQCEQLAADNRQLRATAAAWQHERQQLIEKNTLACSHIQSIISRLKRLEIPYHE